ncbi:MAG: DUF1499 domain-containing protein [Pseudomonadota bacterium]
MTDQVLRAAGGSRLTSRIGDVGFGLAVIAFLLLAVAPLGWHAGWWHFRFAFFTLMPYSAYIGAGAAVISLIGVVAALVAGTRRGLVLGAIGLVAGAVLAYVPWSYSHASDVLPRMHDITTDMENPPSFSAVLAARQAEEAGTVVYDAKLAELQKRGYPDIAPVTTALPPAEAFSRALDTAKALGWTIVSAVSADGHIEASQSSFWFHFTDDIVIRVAARADGQPGSRIDIRSVSGRDVMISASTPRASVNTPPR